jgi:hypothetical protein
MDSPPKELLIVSYCLVASFDQPTYPARTCLANENPWLREVTLQCGGNDKHYRRYRQHNGDKSAVTADIRASRGEAIHEQDAGYLRGVKA